MSFPGRQHMPSRHPASGGYDEGPLDRSDRTPASYGRSEYTGYTGYTGAYTEAYTQGGYTHDESGRTPYTEGMYTEQWRSYADSQYYGANIPSQHEVQSVRSSLGEGSGRHSSLHKSDVNSTQQYHDGSSVNQSLGGTTVAGGGRGRCPYQIEYKVTNQGKKLSGTKRLILFRFGYANSDALMRGETGIGCRGEEHDLVVGWSITGGKRSIHMNGREITFSAGKRANASRRADLLEAAFRVADHTYEVRCYAYKPATGSPEKRDPNWRQYSLVIDGRSFFELPQIYDLGLKGLVRHANPPSQVYSNAPSQVSVLSYSASGGPDVKNAVQARIERQRKLMKQKKREEKRQHRVEDESERSGTTSIVSDLESMGLESAVHSAAPTELDAMKNRKGVPPTDDAEQEDDMVLYQPAVKPGSENPHSSQPQQQMKIEHRQNQMPPPGQPQCQNANARSQSSAQHYQIQKLPPRPRNATANQSQQLQIEAQQRPHNAHDTHTEQQQARPPTYEEIRSSMVPRKVDLDIVVSSNVPVGHPTNPPHSGRATPSSSVDQRGINKWGYF
ncbi:hypothetical protein ACHAXT_000718 [Thalassiosira profunda]